MKALRMPRRRSSPVAVALPMPFSAAISEVSGRVISFVWIGASPRFLLVMPLSSIRLLAQDNPDRVGRPVVDQANPPVWRHRAVDLDRGDAARHVLSVVDADLVGRVAVAI